VRHNDEGRPLGGGTGGTARWPCAGVAAAAEAEAAAAAAAAEAVEAAA
jgi:hypothetical protein